LGYRKILATYALNLGGNLGIDDCKPWHNFENAAPIVHLMVALLNAVDGKSTDFKDAVTLLKEAKASGSYYSL